MTLSEMSANYRASGELCKQRVKDLEAQLADQELTQKETLKIRRRITVLTAMARDAIRTAIMLEGYYGGQKDESKIQERYSH